MSELRASGILYVDGVVSVLDQQLLPHKEVWVPCENLEAMVSAIRALKVRGAPAIGVAASLFVGSEVGRGGTPDELLRMTQVLRESRPTAVNLMNYMDRIDLVLREGGSDWSSLLVREVEAIFQEDVELCERIAANGLAVLPENPNILTHCNTGSLATAGRGTALGIITKAYEVGQRVHVFVDETRPLLQGGRLTTWELKQAGISHQLITDSMAGMLMKQGDIDCVIVGADRIALNGDFANKIGTYGLAVLCRHHNIPFFVAAPETTIDRDCLEGSLIPIEERDPKEVCGFFGSSGEVMWAPADTPVFNPAFDVTPAELVTGWILDSGVKRASDWAA